MSNPNEHWNIYVTCPWCYCEDATERTEKLAFSGKVIFCRDCEKRFRCEVKQDKDYFFKSIKIEN